jgi:non-specific serine/threonine protein kinase
VTFGELLRQYRLAARLSQEALAESAGLGVRSIQGLERGAHRPLRDTLDRLVVGLGLTKEERACFLATAQRPSRRPRPSGAAVLPPAPPALQHNLPLQLTSFIGREQELVEVEELLASTRLLTLTGTGGVGKTRLALQVAAAQLDRYPQGVWLVGLAPLADPTLVPGAVLAALGVPEQPGRLPLATLLDALRTRELLLVLDNCEHLLDACAGLAEALLCACPDLRLLATSREALGLTGETRYRVPSLAVPGADQAASPTAVARCAAVRLFVERARAVQPAFVLSAANAAAVAEVCARLDGIPLALELAAARLGGLGLAELAARLDRQFQLLTGGSRTALPRQQTLRATVAWSYDLLTPQEQTLFARLSVFAGGWSLEGAEAVGAGGTIAAEEVLDLLARLVDKSLAVAEETADGSTWYRLLETLRQYGQERLAAAAETAQVRHRHAAYYQALAERADRRFTGPDQLRWLDLIEREHDNLRAALTWCLEGDAHQGGAEAAEPVETGMRLAGALFWFWFFRDHDREGLVWLERALTQGSAAPAAVRAKALFGAAVFASTLRDFARSAGYLSESIVLSRAAGDTRQLILALSVLGGTVQDEQAVAAGLEESVELARALGEPWLLAYTQLHVILVVLTSTAIQRVEERARARAAGAESLHLFQAAGVRLETAMVQLFLGQLALYEGDYEPARAAFVACLPTIRTLGWRRSVADGLVGLADVAREQGHAGEATAFYAEGLALYRQIGDQCLIARALCRLADLSVEQDDWEAARAPVAEILAIAQDTGQVEAPELAGALEVRAALAEMQGAPLQAVRLAGAAAALHAQGERPAAASVGGRPAAASRPAWLRPALASSALSAAEHATAWAEGQAMTRERAIAYALEGLPAKLL